VGEGKSEPNEAEGCKAAKSQGEAAASTAAGLAKKVGEALIPVLITGGSLVGFVAFAGAVVLWTRFEAVEVPPEKAIDLAPQGELVSIGSVLLLVLGFFGALALLGVFLVDRRARPTPGMARALVALLALEGVLAIVHVEGASLRTTVVAMELFLLPLAVAALATTMGSFGRLVDNLEERTSETLEPLSQEGLLRPPSGPPTRRDTRRLSDRARNRATIFVLGPIALVVVVLVAAAIAILVFGSEHAELLALSIGAALFAAWSLVLIAFDRKTVRVIRDRRRDEETARGEEKAQQEEAAHHEKEASCRSDPARDPRVQRPRPLRLELTAPGAWLVGASLAAAVAMAWLQVGVHERWLPVSLAVAALLAVALWRIAELANDRLVWFGVAVFLSVPLFGTVSVVADNFNHPKVQPVALIRKSDGPAEAIQGLYVTETGDRVYFANIATEGCGEEVTPHSGRLLSVPSEEVVAMSLGPLQKVEEAGKSALEMSYALTPAIETQGTSVDLGIGKKQKAEERKNVKWNDTRLENAGPAVRPNFGSGLRLEPDSAAPGESVTLRMSKPNSKVKGFGSSRDGHNLRVGGVLADILKEKDRMAWGAEYVELAGGRLVHLAKEGPYVREGRRYVPLKKGGARKGGDLYVKIQDPNVRAIDGKSPEGNEYIRIKRIRVNGEGRFAVVDARKEVTLAGGEVEGERWERETLRMYGRPLLRQAWRPERISFVIPKRARTGVVTVECNQLAGSPLLKVNHAPKARIAVRMQQDSGRVTFSSIASRGEGSRIVSRSWKIGGLRRSHRKRVSVRMPARRGIYTIRLTVTDNDGQKGTARLRLLRLPTPLFEFDKAKPEWEKLVSADRKVLLEAVREDPPVSIELDGHADDPGSLRYNLELSLERDKQVRRDLMPSLSQADAEQASPTGTESTVAIEEKAYGERCPVDLRPGKRPRNRRVDIFVLDRGVTVKPPAGCHPGRVKSAAWRYPPHAPSHDKAPQGEAEGSGGTAAPTSPRAK
jgi:hypothetical protein